MINAGTVLNVVDNIGILKARCMKVYKLFFYSSLNLRVPRTPNNLAKLANVSNTNNVCKVSGYIKGKNSKLDLGLHNSNKVFTPKFIRDCNERIEPLANHGCIFGELVDVSKKKTSIIYNQDGVAFRVKNKFLYSTEFNGKQVDIYEGPTTIIDGTFSDKYIKPKISEDLESLDTEAYTNAKKGVVRYSVNVARKVNCLYSDSNIVKFISEATQSSNTQFLLLDKDLSGLNQEILHFNKIND